MKMNNTTQTYDRHNDFDDATASSYSEMQAELQAEIEYELAETARPKTPVEQLEIEINEVKRQQTTLGGFGSDEAHAELHEQLSNLRKQLKVAREEEFYADWTREVTAERRDIYNAAVIAGKLETYKQQADFRHDNGWWMDDLKTAVAHWKAN